MREPISDIEARAPDWPVDYILLKLAARCNIACTYCYWFRDQTVYDKPKTLLPEVETALIEKLERHIRTHGLKNFFILFHGGEPLLFGKRRFAALCAQLRDVEKRCDFKLKLAVTTNGILVDEDWARLFHEHQVGVTISVDGPTDVNDRRRVDFRGRGTYERVLRGVAALRGAGLEPGFLAVCDPQVDPGRICSFFLDEIGTKQFDILVPDRTHEDPPLPIGDFYTALFDLWHDRYAAEGVHIRFLESIAKGLLGFESRSESIGFGPNITTTLHTDGSLESLDVLRIGGDGLTASSFNILTHELQEARHDPFWREALHASLNLHDTCRACPYHFACGGGHLASRWSNAKRLDNPSAHCDELKKIFQHTWNRIAPDLYFETPAGRVELAQAFPGAMRGSCPPPNATAFRDAS